MSLHRYSTQNTAAIPQTHGIAQSRCNGNCYDKPQHDNTPIDITAHEKRSEANGETTVGIANSPRLCCRLHAIAK